MKIERKLRHPSHTTIFSSLRQVISGFTSGHGSPLGFVVPQFRDRSQCSRANARAYPPSLAPAHQFRVKPDRLREQQPHAILDRLTVKQCEPPHFLPSCTLTPAAFHLKLHIDYIYAYIRSVLHGHQVEAGEGRCVPAISENPRSKPPRWRSRELNSFGR